MKKLIFLLAPVLMTACVKSASDYDTPENPEKPWNEFDFTTSAVTSLSLDYAADAAVYFEIYDTAPVRENESGTAYEKVEGIEPLYAGITDEQGRFSAQIELPTYLDKAYVYTPNVHAQTLLTAEKKAGVLTASAAEEAEATALSATRAGGGYESDAVTKDGWKTWLGTYDNTYGRIDYAYKGDELREKNWKQLFNAANKVFDTSKACPKEYRSSSDLYLEKDAEVAITFLMSNTCWNCSMGYYYYDASKHPASLADVHPVMIFPNTQDGKWSNDPKKANKYKGVNRGTAVQLIFYPNIAEGSMEGATTTFPKGYRIGFVLATNAWGNRLPGFTGTKKYRAATSDGLSVNDKGVAYKQPRTAVYRYTNNALNLNSVICSFEDYTTDQNFSDVIFTMKSNPVDAVVDIPSVEEKPGAEESKKEVRLLKGIYAFEDLWPSQGDYDMNDVMVKLDYEKTFGDKGIYEESYLFKTFNNIAGLENGLAFTLGGDTASAELEFSILRPASEKNSAPEYEVYTPERDGNVILLTDNVKGDMGATYKVTAKYASPISDARAAVVKPFIYRTTDKDLAPGKRKEVHLPFEAPTGKVDMSFFGTSDDKSDPNAERYYVRANSYPFAFYLAGATEIDLAKLLDPKNEKTPVDQLYPAYSGWVSSNGGSNTNWYK
ncbi:LruC domain-containing protein [Alistipes timonensis]